MIARGLVVAALLVACSSAPDDGEATPDAGTTTPDAGTPSGPLPAPLARTNDPRTGTSYSVAFQGLVDEHGPARDDPFPDLTPARVLRVKLVDGSRKALYYTLPTGFAFAAFPNENVSVLYRERVSAAGFSSHGARVTTVAGELRALFEDGSAGPALEEAERLGFTFELDDGQPLDEETETCGRRVHYPLIVEAGGRRRRILPGESDVFPTTAGNLRFTLLDAWRIADSLCGDAPALSLAWFAKPAE